MITVNFHIHTKYSHDSNLEPTEILKIAKKLKFDVLGICDHNTTKGGIETKKLTKDILILVGQEIKTEYGDIVIFGTEKNLKGNLFEILNEAKSKKLFVVLPHPFDRFRKTAIGNNLKGKKLREVLKKIDAIEVFNSRCPLDIYNKKAQKIAAEFKIPGIAASDAHFANELNNAKNFLDCKKEESEIYKTIREGKVKWTGKKSKQVNYLKIIFHKIF
ncbi:MAG: PHP domain-containing protein [Candidatus Aenigmarchaeota archaeon]|nr:PHP domain-containing protein [Candidatus Aenigmarchaeota archaeon]